MSSLIHNSLETRGVEMGLGIYERTSMSLSSMSASSEFSRRSPIWSSVENASTMSSAEAPQDKLWNTQPSRKLLKFASLKNLGTTVKNDSGNYEYYYNPTETGSNPYNSACVDKENGYSVQLVLDASNRKIYMPDLPTRREDLSSLSHRAPIFESSSTAVIPNASSAAHVQDNCSSGVTVSGMIRVAVANTERPIVLKSHKIYLKCFVSEYACYVDTTKKSWRKILGMNCQSDEKVIRILPHPEDDSLDSHLLPFKMLEIDLAAESQARYLTTGVHEFSFTFAINLNEFPASCRTVIGSTMYRIESRMNVANAKKRNDTVILTEKIDVTRVLSITNNIMKYESINIEGSWNRDEFFYHIFLATKMIEIDEPFTLTIGMMKGMQSKMTIENIKISLAQATSIPCIDCDTRLLLSTSYVKKNSYELYNCDFPHSGRKIESEFHQFYELDNLLIPKYNCSLSNSWLRPYYCEPSTQLQRRARLKITHTLNVQLTLNNCTRRDSSGVLKPATFLTFRIPILLVDSDMLGNLSLPQYRPSETRPPPEYTCAAFPPTYE